jgi:hypothetical protein
MRKLLLVFLVSGVVLTMVACGSFGRNPASSTLSVSNPGAGSPGIVLPANPIPTPIQNADLSVAPLSPSIAVDSTVQFVATAKASGAEVHWASSSPSVATIDSRGLATGLSAGTTQITATAGGITSTPVVLTLCDFRHL